MTPVIIDAVVAVALAGFGLYGAKRGLLGSFAGLVSVVFAIVGAGIIAATFAPLLSDLAAPVIEGHIQRRMDAVLEEKKSAAMESEGADAVGDLLDRLGLDADFRGSVLKRTEETVRDTGVSAASAVVESLAYSFFYGALYLLSFIALTVLLRLLLKAMDLFLRVPGLHALNALGGGAIGLIEGGLLLFLTVWVLRRLGVSFDTPLLEEAHILRVFTDCTPLSVLTFLQ